MAREERYSRNFMALSTSSTPGFGYPDPNLQNHLGTNQIHAFGSDPEIFNLTTGMEMIGFNIPSSKPTTNPQHHHQNHPESSSDFYDFYTKPEFTDWETHNARFVPDDSSLRCVFPSHPHPGPSQSLSLSLNPASQAHPQGGEGGGGGEDGFLVGRNSGHGSSAGTGQEVRSSKYLGPAQELLNEFCSLGITEVGSHHDPHKQKHRKSNHSKDWVNAEDLNASGSSSSTSRNNSSLDFVALQKRKSKLMLMLDEVERRYKHYCDQMKAVVSSFEAVAGEGAATVYSAVASNTMSRHFRRLRDGIVGQIKATNKVMGEEASAIRPGTTRGETPRLRVLEQTIRQQKAFQQLNMVEGSLIAWRPQRGLPEQSVSVLRSWLFEHFLHPYPSDVDKHILARQTGLSRSQVSNWFINARVRLWKPMVEEMYLEETKDHQQPPETSSPSNAKPTQDLKPKPDELMGEAVGIVEPPPPPPFGTVELDFTNYNQQYGSGLVSSYLNNNNANPNFGGVSGGGGVSLTLGLQQQQGGGRGDGGVSLAFSPSQSSLFYSRGHIEDRGSVQYPILEGANDTQNLPYRNLMGAQLLHDLAG